MSRASRSIPSRGLAEAYGYGLKNCWKCIGYLIERKATKASLFLPNRRQNIPKKYLTKVRLGQGAFRVQLTDTYFRKCAVTGEKTLPALEAAHIKAFAESGPYQMGNGILLRADLHKLFDSGYITITSDYKVEVSRRIKEEFENGKEYYRLHGSGLSVLPVKGEDRPQAQYIEWHNTNIFNG